MKQKIPSGFLLLEGGGGWMDGLVPLLRIHHHRHVGKRKKREKRKKENNVKRILNISKGPCCVCANNRTKRTDRRTRRQGPPFVIPIERHNKTTRSSVFILFPPPHNKNKRKFEFHLFYFYLKKAPKIIKKKQMNDDFLGITLSLYRLFYS
jgi:hypothetical protein